MAPRNWLIVHRDVFFRRNCSLCRIQIEDEEAKRFEGHIDSCSNCRDTLVATLDRGPSPPNWLDVGKKKTLYLTGGSPSHPTRCDESLNYSPNDNRSDLSSVGNLALVGSERYRFEQMIGEGGMGVVWEGTRYRHAAARRAKC